MEYALLELIPHEEMRCILKKRYLDVKNIDKLSPLELESMYRRFALPRARRNNRRANVAAAASAKPYPNTHLEEQAMALVIPNADMCATNIDEDSVVYVESVTCPEYMDQSEKRPLDNDVYCGTDSYLSSATKRIKIDWS